jgi:hypothetical protein
MQKNESPTTKKELQEHVLRMVTLGRSFSELSKDLKAQGHTEDAIASAMDAALFYYRALAEFNPDEELGKAYTRLNLLFMACMKIQDYKGALSVQKELNRLLSIGQKPKQPTPCTGRVIDASIAQILDRQ